MQLVVTRQLKVALYTLLSLAWAPPLGLEGFSAWLWFLKYTRAWSGQRARWGLLYILKGHWFHWIPWATGRPSLGLEGFFTRPGLIRARPRVCLRSLLYILASHYLPRPAAGSPSLRLEGVSMRFGWLKQARAWP